VSHRAQQIVDAMAALISTDLAGAGVAVFVHRRLTVADYELPAVSVDYGADEVQELTASGIYSDLMITTTAVYAGTEENETRSYLLDLRRDIHRAVMASPGAGLPFVVNLGLSFVVGVSPAGADAPVIEAETESMIGSYAIKWRVLYTTPVDDPDP